jgi:hypothetical protein
LTLRDDFVVFKKDDVRRMVTRTVKEISLFALSSACLLVALTMMQRTHVRLARSADRVCWSAAEYDYRAPAPYIAGHLSRRPHALVIQAEFVTATAVAVSLGVVPLRLRGLSAYSLQVSTPAFSLRAPPLA